MMGHGRPRLIAIADVGSADPRLVGGKAAGFAVLSRAGLPAPDGFVVTTAVHRTALADSGRLPDGIADEIAERVRRLGGGPLAVRSSAAGEDGHDHSHAGQYLTRLGVRGEEEALGAVLECWASATDPRAQAYRAHRGETAHVEMAVVVQRLVEAECAGVCMSCDPVTGDARTIVVNAAHGLGELVVSGLVTPDDYRLNREDGRLSSFVAGDKDIMLVMGPDGPVEVEVPQERREERVLGDDHLGVLHDGVLRCERELGHPADCEFAVAGGEVLWLQCRPMTALSRDPASPHEYPALMVPPTDDHGAAAR